MTTESRKLYRSKKDRMLGGVCAGLGEFFGIDPTIMRLVFVLGFIFGFGSFAFIYLVMLLVVPNAPDELPVPIMPPVESTDDTNQEAS
jgi:phage shock protein C